MPRWPGIFGARDRRQGRPVRSKAALLALPAAFLAGLSPVAADEPALVACAGDRKPAVPVTFVPGEDVFVSADGTRHVAVDLRYAAEARPGDFGEVSARAVPLGPPDRWERIPSWIVVKDKAGGVRLWQAQMLETGQALFAPDRADAACATVLRRAEARARRAGAGLWRNEGAGLMFSAARPKSFKAAAGRYVIVRGRVVSLGKTRSTRYLNFGKYWKTDVTGTLKSADEEAFNARLGRAGRSLDGLAGAYVEIRGIVETLDGPHIALRHPEQLVVLDD